MNDSEKNLSKCIVCNIPSNENYMYIFEILVLYSFRFQSKFLQKLIPHIPKFQQEINSLCQELDSLDKAFEPNRKKIIVLLENFLQKKANRSLKDVGNDFNLCRTCGGQK